VNLIDTSAWIEFLRGSDTTATAEVRRLLADEPVDVAMCEPVAMELLAGATTERRLAQLEQLVNGLPELSVDPVMDFRSAAAIYRSARRSGRTIRSLNDCLIGAVALRHGATVVHQDVDFEVMADVTALEVRCLR
jgi:predicted nucleic acid-binding protein